MGGRRVALVAVLCGGVLVGWGCGRSADRQTPGPWEAHYRTGLQAMDQGRYAAADSALERAWGEATAFPPQDARLRSTLDALARVMADGAELRFASDHMDYVRWTLDHICRHGAFAWTARRPADWRQRPADAVETRYEAKARADRSACVHLIFRRRHR